MAKNNPKLIFFNLTEDGHVFRSDEGPKLNLYSPIVIKTVDLPYKMRYTISICLLDIDRSISNIIKVQIIDPEGIIFHSFKSELNEIDPDNSNPLVLYGSDDLVEINTAGLYKVDVFLNELPITNSYFIIGEKNK